MRKNDAKIWKWSQNTEESTQTKIKTYTKPFKRLSLSGEHKNKDQYTIIILVSSTFSTKSRTLNIHQNIITVIFHHISSRRVA